MHALGIKMSNYSVIKSDLSIYKDGEMVEGCDMSGLPEDFHVLQWDGSDGYIEYSDVLKPNLKVSTKSEIESALGVSLTVINERRDARIAEIAEIENEWLLSFDPEKMQRT